MSLTQVKSFDRMQVIDKVEDFRQNLGPRFQRGKIEVALFETPEEIHASEDHGEYKVSWWKCTDSKEASKAMNVLRSLGYQIYHDSKFLGVYISVFFKYGKPLAL